jgi:hypothetical protein
VPPPDDKQDDDRPAGRVRHDPSGRAVWEWAVESGRHAIDSTSRLLKRLDLPGLKIADDEVRKDDEADPPPGSRTPDGKPIPTFGGSREADPLASGRKSFNPYDNRASVKRTAAPTQKAPAAAGARPAAKSRPAQSPTAKRGFFARLFGRS